MLVRSPARLTSGSIEGLLGGSARRADIGVSVSGMTFAPAWLASRRLTIGWFSRGGPGGDGVARGPSSAWFPSKLARQVGRCFSYKWFVSI